MSDEQMEISEADADKAFFTQVLTGDPVDGYKGVPGIGPKKAETILGTRPSWGAVEQAFIKAGMTRDDAIQQARLARILRWTDWHDEIQEIRLWTP
jgi:DNA polymerase I